MDSQIRFSVPLTPMHASATIAYPWWLALMPCISRCCKELVTYVSAQPWHTAALSSQAYLSKHASRLFSQIADVPATGVVSPLEAWPGP